MTPDYSKLPFQLDWVHTVKRPFSSAGTQWETGDFFDWKQRSISWENVLTLFNQGFLRQEPPSEKLERAAVGDGLDELDQDELSAIVKNINAKVRQFTKTTREYNMKKCKASTVTKKQRGHIRTWRNSPWADWEQA